MGLVTLEDIIEEIVGDITDETDIASIAARVQPDGSLIVDGSVPIRDVNRMMDWDIPDDEATTIAGLVIHEAQTIPEQGRPSPSMASASRCCGGSETASRTCASRPSTRCRPRSAKPVKLPDKGSSAPRAV